MPAVEIENLTKRFGDLVAVDGLNLTVERGEVFGLVGPDGAGKTTTFRCATTAMPPTSGTARVVGYDVRTQPDEVRERIGYVSQRFSLYGDLTVEENLAFSADIYRVPKKDRAKRKADLLAFSRLGPFQNRLAQFLSGGMKQKLALACALMHTPEVLFLDEPTTGVDPVSRRDFWRLLYALVRDGLTLVVSTPYMDEAERCNRIGLMAAGKLVLCDTPAALKGRMKGDLLEVRCDRQREAHALLKRVPAVQELQVFGDTLHLRVAEAASAWPEVEAALTSVGITAEDWRQTVPSLEDVFVSLVASSPASGGSADG